MITTNCYPEFSDFESRLIKRVAACLARRLHMSRQDREEYEQELAVYLWQKKAEYDPDHESGSGYETFITNCIENKALDIQKDFFRDLQNSECRPGRDTSDEEALHINGHVNGVETEAILRADLASAIKNLSPDQKQLVGQLACGKSIPEIALESGQPYISVYSRVRRLRVLFRQYGFNASMN